MRPTPERTSKSSNHSASTRRRRCKTFFTVLLASAALHTRCLCLPPHSMMPMPAIQSVVASYGDGCDAFIVEVTPEITRMKGTKRGIKRFDIRTNAPKLRKIFELQRTPRVRSRENHSDCSHRQVRAGERETPISVSMAASVNSVGLLPILCNRSVLPADPKMTSRRFDSPIIKARFSPSFSIISPAEATIPSFLKLSSNPSLTMPGYTAI